MPRTLTSAFIDEATAARCEPCLFVEMELRTQTLRLWTGLGDITWDGETWLGNGYFQNVTGGEETSDIQATSIVFHLTAVPEAQVALALSEFMRNKPGSLWFGFLDAAGDVVADPALMFEGKLDAAELVETPEGSNLQVTYQSNFADLERSSAGRYTDAGQKKFYPEDKGFEFVEKVRDRDLRWGSKKSNTKRPPKKRAPSNPFN